jgi:hypothetical protein
MNVRNLLAQAASALPRHEEFIVRHCQATSPAASLAC